MRISDLKLDIINKVTNITDKVKLEELIHFIDFQNSENIYHVSEEDEKAIIEARKQIAEGETVSNEEVQNEVWQMLKL